MSRRPYRTQIALAWIGWIALMAPLMFMIWMFGGRVL